MPTNNQYWREYNNNYQMDYINNCAQTTPQMPIELLPTIVSEAIEEIHQNTGTPKELITAACLGVMSTSSQGIYDVSPISGFTMPTSLILIAIAESGTGKTTAIKNTFKPIFEFERIMDIRHKEELMEYQIDLETWNVINKNLKGKIKTSSDEKIINQFRAHQRNKPTKPKITTITISDYSEAGLINALSNNSKTIAIVSAEADEILNRKEFKNPTQFLKTWSNEDSTKARDNSEYTKIQESRTCITAFTNKEKFDEFKHGNGKNSKETGLYARTLFIKITKKKKTPLIASAQKEEKKEILHLFIRNLLNETFITNKYNEKRICLNFTKEATNRWCKIVEEVSCACEPGGHFEHHHEYAAKWPENVARIAALFHIFDQSTGEISLNTLDRAEKICSWFADEFIGIFPQQHADITLQQKAKKLREFIVSECQKLGKMEIPFNRILQYGRGVPREKIERDKITDYLIQHGLVHKYKIGKITYISPCLLP